MPSIGIASGIALAVGQQPARNRKQDQDVVTDLLIRVPPQDGGRADLPPTTPGPIADFRLVNAIFQFQLVMVGRGFMPRRFADGRVDPNGTTIKLLNRFAEPERRGGGLVIPIDPPQPVPPAPAPRKGAGFLQPLFTAMTPRPTNLQIAGTGSVAISVAEIGAVNGKMQVEDITIGPPVFKLKFRGAGLSLGPLPFGVEIAPSNFPSQSSRIHAGPRTKSTKMTTDDLKGFCLMIGASVNPAIPFGSNATTIMFNIGRNRSLELKFVIEDALSALDPNRATAFVMDSFRTCQAWGNTIGVFFGASVGVSLMEVLLEDDGGNIRPDPDVRSRLLNLR